MHLNFLKTPAIEVQNKITLWLNHMLVVYAFLIPINNNAKSSLFFTMLLLFLYRRNFVYYLKDAFQNKIVQAFLLFYLIGVIGMFYTENMEMAKSHMDYAKYLLFPLFFLSFLDKRFAFRVIGGFVLGMFFTELISYLINFRIFPPVFYIGEYEIWKTSLASPAPFFNHIKHNYGLALVIAFLLYQYLNKKSLPLSVKLFSIIFMTTATINMSFVAGRTGYVIFLILIFLVFLLSYPKKILKALAVSSILIAVLVYFGYNHSSTIKHRVDQTISSYNKIVHEDDYKSSIGYRLGFAKYSLEVIMENPLFGVGTGDFMDEVRIVIPNKHSYLADEDRLARPHNNHIQVLLQFGLIGYFAMLYVFYQIYMYKKDDKYNHNLLIIVSTSILLYMMTDHFFATFSLPLFVTLVSALITNEQRDITYTKITPKILLSYFGIVILFLIIGITR
jgi:O-antigen ligase